MTVFVNPVGAARRAMRVVLAVVGEEREADEDVREVVVVLGRAVAEETTRVGVDAVLRDPTAVELLDAAAYIASVPSFPTRLRPTHRRLRAHEHELDLSLLRRRCVPCEGPLDRDRVTRLERREGLECDGEGHGCVALCAADMPRHALSSFRRLLLTGTDDSRSISIRE